MGISINITRRAARVGGLVVVAVAVLGLAAVAGAHPGPTATGVIHSCVGSGAVSYDASGRPVSGTADPSAASMEQTETRGF